MKDYIGKKIRGFRFEDGTDGVDWLKSKEDCIGKIGVITDQIRYSVFVDFNIGLKRVYPISLIEQHLVDVDTNVDTSPEIIDLTNVKSVEMMVSQDEEDWFKAKVIAKLVDAYIDNQGNVWYYVKPIKQLPKYTHAELVEKLGHDFEIIK